MTRREWLAIEPERVDEPGLAASVRALARLAIDEAKKAGSAGKQMITKNQIRARLAGQVTIERKRIAGATGPVTRSAHRARTGEDGAGANPAGGPARQVSKRRFLPPPSPALAPAPIAPPPKHE